MRAPAARDAAQGRRRHAVGAGALATTTSATARRAEALARGGAGDAPRALRRRASRNGDEHGRPRPAAVAARRLARRRAAAAREPRDQPAGARRPIIPTSAAAQSNLGLASPIDGDYAAAEALVPRGARRRSPGDGPVNPGLAITLNNLAWPLREQGKYDEAVAALEEAIARRPNGAKTRRRRRTTASTSHACTSPKATRPRRSRCCASRWPCGFGPSARTTGGSA